ncbi:hypothetical protein [Exiguobacterium sp. Leaf196]|uniref:hypothetical protein n=1 Tax=Exiguobacterium sp. Leaf196 TaxID=1736298 RepID=UPI0006F6733A|nr:hypothetical protein [Exiguobacterium sp. Leaf196]KQS45412.1 hypothetical protein ASG02_05050 [Exiguobacterium sp. Leaf196]
MRWISYAAVVTILSFLAFTAYSFLTTIDFEIVYQFGTFAMTLSYFIFGLPMLWIVRHYPLPLRLLIYVTTSSVVLFLFIGLYEVWHEASLSPLPSIGSMIQFTTLACILFVLPYEIVYRKNFVSIQPRVS